MIFIDIMDILISLESYELTIPEFDFDDLFIVN